MSAAGHTTRARSQRPWHEVLRAVFSSEDRQTAEKLVADALSENAYLNPEYDAYFAPDTEVSDDLDVLFDAAKTDLEDERTRADRLDAKARGTVTFTAAFVAVVQTFALRTDVLRANGEVQETVLYSAMAAGGLLIVALCATAWATLLTRDAAILPDVHLRRWLKPIIEQAVGKGDRRAPYLLVHIFITVAQQRYEANERRTSRVGVAQGLCLLTIIAAGLELIFALYAIK